MPITPVITLCYQLLCVYFTCFTLYYELQCECVLHVITLCYQLQCVYYTSYYTLLSAQDSVNLFCVSLLSLFCFSVILCSPLVIACL